MFPGSACEDFGNHEFVLICINLCIRFCETCSGFVQFKTLTIQTENILDDYLDVAVVCL